MTTAASAVYEIRVDGHLDGHWSAPARRSHPHPQQRRHHHPHRPDHRPGSPARCARRRPRHRRHPDRPARHRPVRLYGPVRGTAPATEPVMIDLVSLMILVAGCAADAASPTPWACRPFHAGPPTGCARPRACPPAAPSDHDQHRAHQDQQAPRCRAAAQASYVAARGSHRLRVLHTDAGRHTLQGVISYYRTPALTLNRLSPPDAAHCGSIQWYGLALLS